MFTLRQIRARQRTVHLFHGLTTSLLAAVVFFTPVAFLLGSADPVELPKTVLFVLLTSLAGVAWVTGWAITGEVRWRRVPGGWLLVGLALVVILSASFSTGHVASLLGAIGYAHHTLASYLAAILFVTLLSQVLDNGRDVARFIGIAFAGLGIAALVGVLQFAGASPFAWSSTAFLMTGNSTATFSVLMGVLAVLSLAVVQRQRERRSALRLVWTIFGYATYALALLGLLASDAVAGWIAAVVGAVVLMTFASLRPLNRNDLTLGVVIVAVAVVGLLLPTGSWLGTKVNPDLRLDVGTSWTVTQKTLAGFPIIGSGPSTFVSDFVRYRPAAFNTSSLAQFRFMKASDEALETLATLGILGSLVLLALVGLILVRFTGVSVALAKREREAWFGQAAFAGAWAGLTAALFFVPTTTTTFFIFWFGLGLLGILVRGPQPMNTWHGSMARPLATVVLVGSVILVVFVGVWSTRLTLVNRLLAQTTAAAQRAEDLAAVRQRIDRIIALSPSSSTAYILRAQAELAQAQVGLQQQQTASAREQVASLLQQAIRDGEVAVSRDPSNPAVLESLAEIYKSVGGVVGNTASLVASAYERAIQLEPENAANHSRLGQVYYLTASGLSQNDKDGKQKEAIQAYVVKARAELETALRLQPFNVDAAYGLVLVDELVGEKDQALRRLEELASNNPSAPTVWLELGIRYADRKDDARARDTFMKAVALDPTAAEAYYQLGLLAERAGDSAGARQNYERALRINPRHSDAAGHLQKLPKS